PDNAFDSIGTPKTGSGVSAAVTPGRCAAPRAPAMMILKPCALAALVKAWCRSGVRWAEMIFASYPMPSASRVSAACFMVGQSDWLPMMIATAFPTIDPSKRPERKAGDYREGRWGGKAAAQACGKRMLLEILPQNEPIAHGSPAGAKRRRGQPQFCQ